MSDNIPRYKKLLMVTDTAMVIKNGKVYAFEPVVRELLVFLELFDQVEWIGFCYPDRIDNPIMQPVPENVKCILLKHTGGDKIFQKLEVLLNMPIMLWYILNGVFNSQVIHTRGPSSPAFLATLISTVFKKKTWWNKYAGNWVQENPPFFYGLQRSWLKKATWTKVTINGKWPDQEPHCLSFENPCLTEEEIRNYEEDATAKKFEGPLTLLFVGRMEMGKGPGRLIEAIKFIPYAENKISEIILIGDGIDKPILEEMANECPVPCNFVGVLNRDELDNYYRKAHIIVLPSTASEGFPKVIAEAAAFGCAPLVSNISSIGQYIHHLENGYLIKDITPLTIANDINSLISDRKKLKTISTNSIKISTLFTYSRYSFRIENEILRT